MCKLGTELLHDFPEISIQDNTILHNSATILGYSKYLYAHDANNILNSSFVNRETFLESYLSGKIKYMEAEHGDSLDLMRQIKQAFDPDNLMNPGKMLPA